MTADQGSTSTNQTNCPYDVFLSFRGPDTRHSFTSFLYDALSRKGLNTFMDEEGLMKLGDQISESLVNAIRQSRTSIVVLSENYANSTWCLDELVEILECKRLNNQLVWPIFYKVAPSDVRHQLNSYATAMAEHEKKFGAGSDKVRKWRSALSEVANLSGKPYKTGRPEYKLIEEIVQEARIKLQRKRIDVGEHIIGHQSCIEEVKSLLDVDSYHTVCMLGIHGIGGMGKTTLAKALYNSIVHQFEWAIFLEGVREKSSSYMGMVQLQEAILSMLCEGKVTKLSSVGEGVTKLKDILPHRRVLLVLDDVDKVDQLEKLAGNCNWFGSGSRIIVTTRDKHVLDGHEVEKRYKMEQLNDDEALQLFCWKAFKKSQPPMDYIEVSNRVVHYASGLPLALKVIGSNLATRSVKACEDALKQYEKIPERNIQRILQISYDCLEDDNAKSIFLDIACFFKGESLEYVKQLWEKCDYCPSYHIEVLVDKSLITIEVGHLQMHDLIQDMGRDIVRLEDHKNPSKRSRLYCHKDVLKVLEENSGSSEIEGIMLDPPKQEILDWSGDAFKEMNKLRILIIRNTYITQEPKYLPNSLILLKWEGCPSKSLPSNFLPNNIVDLSLPGSDLILQEGDLIFKQPKSFPVLEHLDCINFSRCRDITYLPDVSGVPNLSELWLDKCKKLIAIHSSAGFLQKLKILSACSCTLLEDFPRRMSLPSLERLDLRDTSIAFFPHIEERMCAPLAIDLGRSPIKELPDSVSNLIGLLVIRMHSRSLTVGGLSTELFMLPNLRLLELDDCGFAVGESLRRLRNSHETAPTGHSTLNEPHYSPPVSFCCENCGLTDEDLDIILCHFPKLVELVIPGNEFVSLPASITGCASLNILDVDDCHMLEGIPELPKCIQTVIVDGCSSLTSEAYRMLWSLAKNEVRGLTVRMPRKTEIPDWFDHHCKGGIMSFKARRKFPALAVAFILEEHATSVETINLYINGNCCKVFRTYSEGDCATILDLQGIDFGREWPIPDSFLAHEWNLVEIEFKCECECYNDDGRCDISKCNVRSCGAYVYRKETNMKDIQFTCPNSLKRTLSIVDDDPLKRKRSKEAQA